MKASAKYVMHIYVYVHLANIVVLFGLTDSSLLNSHQWFRQLYFFQENEPTNGLRSDQRKGFNIKTLHRCIHCIFALWPYCNGGKEMKQSIVILIVCASLFVCFQGTKCAQTQQAWIYSLGARKGETCGGCSGIKDDLKRWYERKSAYDPYRCVSSLSSYLVPRRFFMCMNFQHTAAVMYQHLNLMHTRYVC